MTFFVYNRLLPHFVSFLAFSFSLNFKGLTRTNLLVIFIFLHIATTFGKSEL